MSNGVFGGVGYLPIGKVQWGCGCGHPAFDTRYDLDMHMHLVHGHSRPLTDWETAYRAGRESMREEAAKVADKHIMRGQGESACGAEILAIPLDPKGKADEQD